MHYHNLNSLFPIESGEAELGEPEGHRVNPDGEEDPKILVTSETFSHSKTMTIPVPVTPSSPLSSPKDQGKGLTLLVLEMRSTRPLRILMHYKAFDSLSDIVLEFSRIPGDNKTRHHTKMRAPHMTLKQATIVNQRLEAEQLLPKAGYINISIQDFDSCHVDYALQAPETLL